MLGACVPRPGSDALRCACPRAGRRKLLACACDAARAPSDPAASPPSRTAATAACPLPPPPPAASRAAPVVCRGGAGRDAVPEICAGAGGKAQAAAQQPPRHAAGPRARAHVWVGLAERCEQRRVEGSLLAARRRAARPGTRCSSAADLVPPRGAQTAPRRAALCCAGHGRRAAADQSHHAGPRRRLPAPPARVQMGGVCRGRARHERSGGRVAWRMHASAHARAREHACACISARARVRATGPPMRCTSTLPPPTQTPIAFVFPGGKICVYTGLLDLLRRDEDLMAMVMGCVHGGAGAEGPGALAASSQGWAGAGDCRCRTGGCAVAPDGARRRRRGRPC